MNLQIPHLNEWNITNNEFDPENYPESKKKKMAAHMSTAQYVKEIDQGISKHSKYNYWYDFTTLIMSEIIPMNSTYRDVLHCTFHIY